MNLTYENIEQAIEIKENQINVLIIENPIFLRIFLQDLQREINGISSKFCLSDNNNILDITKNIELIINIFELNINTRKTLNRLYSMLEKEAVSEEHYLKTAAVKTTIVKYGYDLLQQNDWLLCLNQEIEIIELFKILDIKFIVESDNILDEIINNLEINKTFFNIPLMVLVNLKDFLSEKEVQLLYQQSFAKKIQLLLVETTQRERLPGEKIILIDKDLCEVVVQN